MEQQNRSHYLSAKELFDQLNKSHVENLIPERGGQKDYAPDGTWMQGKRLDKYYDDLSNILQLQHVEVKEKLCHGEWIPESGRVHLTSICGSIFQTLGYVEHGKHMLYQEEALIMMEMGSLEVMYGGVAMTIQDAYSTFLGDAIPIHHYQVYAMLSRLGFIMHRHRGITNVTTYERKIRLDQHFTSAQLFKKRKADGNDINDPVQAEKPLCSNKTIANKFSESKKIKTHHVDISDDLGTNLNRDCDMLTSIKTCDSEMDVDTNGKVKIITWNFSELNFPNLADPTSFKLKMPSTTLLPYSYETDDDQNLYEDAETIFPLKNSSKLDEALNFSHQKSPLDPKVKCKNWGEYKKEIQRVVRQEELKGTPCGHYWDNDFQPLVRPQDATSIANILNRLQIIQEVDPENDEITPVTEDLIVYDVHLPDSKFRKSQPGLPNHRICIRRQEDPVPHTEEIIYLSQLCTDGVPLHWAIVDNGDISFYAFHNVSLPQQIYM